MGKDANNTLFAENQVVDQQPGSSVNGQQLKGEQISEPLQQGGQPAGGFHGDKWHEHGGDQLKNASSPELMNSSTSGFHGDKWQETTNDLTGRRPSLASSLGDAGRFETIVVRPGQRSTEHVTSTFSAGTVEPQFRGLESNVQGDIIKNDTREAKHELLAELKSHTGHADHADHTDHTDHTSHADHTAPTELFGGATFHDGRTTVPSSHLYDGMTQDGRTIAPQAALSQDLLHDGTMRDATIHDGRTRTIHDSVPVTESNPSHLSLAERIVAGVHAGDPLASGKVKAKKDKKDKKDKDKDKKDKKDKKIKGETILGADEHLKNDTDLIPHEHLKKEEPLLADANISGGSVLKRENSFKAGSADDANLNKDTLKKEKHFNNDTHLNQNVNIVEDLHRDGALSKDHHNAPLVGNASLERDSEFSRFQDSRGRDSLSGQDAHVTDHHAKSDLNSSEGTNKQSIKDKVLDQAEKIKEKLGMHKDEHVTAGESRTVEGAPKGHEIATIKIPGIESGDLAAQDMVNHQAKAKKELNAELKEHAGHVDHIAPSEILNHGMGQLNLHENRAVDTHIPSNEKHGALSDQITRDQVLAKSGLNAEIQSHSGTGLLPLGVSGSHAHNDIHNTDLHNRNLHGNDVHSSGLHKDALKDNQAHNNLNNDLHSKDLLKDSLFQNRDISGLDNNHHNQNLHSGEFPSSTSKHVEGGHLANLSANKDDILAKNDLNAEITGMGKDHIVPSEVSHKHGDVHHHSAPEHSHSEKLTDLNSVSPALTSDNILAKKELLEEIKEASVGHKDIILPSELHCNQAGSKDFLSKDLRRDSLGGARRDSLNGTKRDSLNGTRRGSHSRDPNFENTAEFQNKQFEQNNDYLNDKPGGLGAMFKDDVMRDHIQAKKELNAEIKEAAVTHPDHLLPSEVSSAVPAGGVTVIHDGREAQGADRLKSEMNYELAKESIEADPSPPMSFTQKIAASVGNVANAVKETLHL